jgi:uncharacterized protein YrrD
MNTMTRTNRLIGLPVILDGEKLGVVDSVSFSGDGKSVSEITVQSAKLRSGCLHGEDIQLIGERAVIASAKPYGRCHKFQPKMVRDTSGLMLGIVTDALVEEDTLRIAQLEISFGPIDDILTGRRWVSEFCVNGITGETIVPCDVEK